MHPDRVVVGAGRRVALGRGRGRGAVRAARLPGRAHRRRVGGDDQARLERLPRDQDLLHQRDRERLRGGRRGRVARSRAGMGLDPRIGDSFLNAGHRLRRLLLPEGRLRPQAARRQLRLPLPAADGRDRGERAAEAAGREQAQAPSRLAGRQARSRCSGSPSSPTPTTCARPRASCWRRACRARARSCAPTTRSPRTRARELMTGRRDVRLGAGRGRGRGRGRDRHRVARVRRARPGGGAGGGWRTR